MGFISHAIEVQRPAFFFWCPVLIGCGIGLYFNMKVEPSLLLSALITVLCTFCMVFAARRTVTAKFLLGVMLLISLGFSLASVRAHWISAPKLDYRYYGPVTGRIVDISRSHGNAVRVTLDRIHIPEFEKQNTPQRVRISLLRGSPYLDIAPGAWLSITANLSPPSAPAEPGGFDFRRHAWFQQLGAIGYAQSPPVPVDARQGKDGISLWIYSVRMQISDAIRAEIAGPTGAFAAAIVTGDRSEIDPDLLGDLRASNLAHLLAISGLHMGLLTGFVMLLTRYGLTALPGVGLRWPVKKIAAAAALGAGATYLALSGATVATQRAFIMAAVMFGAILVDRQAITLRSVALAALIVLLWRPESMTEAGFQMSFAATTGLVVGFQMLRHTAFWSAMKQGPQRFARPFVMMVFSSAVAGLATAPFSAFHFNQIAQYGLLANLLAVPMMGLIVMPAAVLAAIASLVGLHEFPLLAMGLGIDWILGAASFVANLEGAVRRVPAGDALVLPLIAFGALFSILWQDRARVLGAVIAAFGFWAWAQSERPMVLVSQDGRLIGVETEVGRSISHEKGNGFAARSWLENDGDQVTQKLANHRTAFTFVDGVLRSKLGGSELVQIRSKKIDPQRFCSDGVILVASEAWDKPNGGCIFLGKRELRRFGSVAMFDQDGSVRIEGAKPAAGRRLWSQ